MNREAILGVVRHVLTTAGGYLAGSGVLNASEVEAAAGAITVLVGVVWSIFDKRTRTA